MKIGGMITSVGLGVLVGGGLAFFEGTTLSFLWPVLGLGASLLLAGVSLMKCAS